MTQAAFLLSLEAFDLIYSNGVLPRLRQHAQIGPLVTPAHDWTRYRESLARTEVVFSGWGAPVMNETLLAAMPNLKAIFYAGGSVRYFVTDALWNRGVRITTAATINAIPVAEYTIAAVLLGLKRFWHYARFTREHRTFPVIRPVPGVYHSKVGLVSYGIIGRLVRQRLRAHDIRILVYDPLITDEEAAHDEIHRAGLDELFAECDVVSVHTPLLPETIGLITGEHLRLMKRDTLFINTARGEIVDEPGMIEALRRRPDLQALLDVSAPEPPPNDSPLYTLPNVILTPHIAGSLGPECQRLGHAMVDEFERYRAGGPLLWELTPDRAALIA